MRDGITYNVQSGINPPSLAPLLGPQAPGPWLGQTKNQVVATVPPKPVVNQPQMSQSPGQSHISLDQ